VLFAVPPNNSRFFAIPLLGGLVRFILMIPHLIVLYALTIVVIYIFTLFMWAIVLFTGRYPPWGYSMVGGYLRWTTRVSAYLLGLTDKYPPFQLAN